MTKITCDCGAEFVVTPTEDKGPKSRYYDGYSKGHDELEARIAETIGEEADSIERTIQDVVRDVVRQRDLMREAINKIHNMTRDDSVFDVTNEVLGEVDCG